MRVLCVWAKTEVYRRDIREFERRAREQTLRHARQLASSLPGELGGEASEADRCDLKARQVAPSGVLGEGGRSRMSERVMAPAACHHISWAKVQAQ